MYLNPKWILVEFLRSRLTDPRARAEDSNTENFTATSGQTEFVLTPDTSLSCIVSVTDNGTDMHKWRDYYIDLRNNKIIFHSGRTEGNTISVEYKQGSTNWIYPDKPLKTLSESAFPRIDVLLISGTGIRLGQYENNIESSFLFQIDVWTKEKTENQIFTIDGNKYAGENLADYLSWKIIHSIEDYEEDLHPALYDAIIRQVPRDLPFNTEYRAHHKVIEVELSGIKSGRI